MFNKLAIGIGTVIVIAAIVICAVPLRSVAYEVAVPYEETETYYEKEPYMESIPVDYAVVEASFSNWVSPIGSDMYITIKNTDIKSGDFKVRFDLITAGGATVSRIASEYIAIGEEKRVQVSHSGDYIRTYIYSITPPSKEVTVYKDVEKERIVTRVRQETRYKQVTLLDYLLHY